MRAARLISIPARASVEEMLLLNHPLDCPICDKSGECTLQDYYMAHDLQDGRQDFVRFRKDKAKVIGPTMVLDQQRCVLCDRCVRFLRDVAGDERHIGGHSLAHAGRQVVDHHDLIARAEQRQRRMTADITGAAGH